MAVSWKKVITEQDDSSYKNSNVSVSDLGGGSGTTQYLRKDGSWATPPDNNTTYTNSSWTITSLSGFNGSTSNFLRGDGTWVTPPDNNTTYSNSDWTVTSLSGFGSSTTTYLRNDGTFATPPDNNTTYSAGSGIDINGSNVISLESDSRGDLFQMGRDTNDYYIVNTTDHSWYLDGVLDMKLTNAGTLHVDDDVIAYSTTTASDKRLKSDICELQDNLDNVMSLEPVKFDWVLKDRGVDIGFIAQDVQKVIPEVVKEVNTIGETAEVLEDDTMLTIDYAKLVPVLVGAIQELKAEIDELKRNK